MAACVAAAAAFQSPSITASCNFSRSGMGNSVEFMLGIQHGGDVLHRRALTQQAIYNTSRTPRAEVVTELAA
jgi:hypothetical protein